MELIKLNENNQAGPLVENYDSLIWTERFNTMSDFQITTGDINGFMEKLPKQTAVSLRDTTVPMLVETHDIERKKGSPAKLTIKGRAFESILDRRVSIKAVVAAITEWMVVAKIPSDVAHFIIYKICVEGINDAADIFPADKVQFLTPDDYMLTSGPNREFAVQRGNLLATVLSLLQTQTEFDPSTVPPTPQIPPHGLRSIRPGVSGTANAITIYRGTDRSSEILFDASRDMLDDGRYLFSDVGSANAAYVLGPNAAAKMHQGASVPTGLERRVILVDSASSQIDSDEALRAQGSRALSDAHVTALYNGSINEDLSPYIFGVDYFLGDIVTLQGDYGLQEKARVTEYIRSYGPEGYKSYPTLVSIEGES